ncbi:uncharacterized protein LOC121563228, partial [Coregonus clupeaformis]|uniref:uncharacterized protein LOC121563228 n=1 Tax=Coregonus clupeaformis TaxID=59861 RepID=UPI001E1C9D53
PRPPPEKQEVRSPSPNIILRRHADFLTNQKAAWDSDSEGEAEGEEGGGGVRKVPDVRRDDLASRRAPRPPAAPRVHQYIPPPACSLRDRELWEDIRRASHTALMERSHLGGVDDSHSHTPPPNPGPSSPLSPEAPPTLLELETHLAQYERAEREEEEGGGRDGGKVPDLQKDDMMARRTGAFPRTPITMATTFNRFLPLPGGSKRPAQEVVTERKLQQPRVSMDVPQQHPDVAMVVRPPAPSHCNYDDDEDEEDDDEDEGERPVPDLEKDDMLARRTGAFQCSAGGTGRSFNLFLPVPGAAQQKNTPAGGPNQLYKNTPSGGPNQLYKNTPSGGPNQLYENTPSGGPNQLYKNTPSGGPNQLYKNTPSGGPNQLYKNTPSDGPNQLYKNTPSDGPNQLYKNTPSGGPNQLYKNSPSGGPNQLYKNTPSDGPNQLYKNTPSDGTNQLYRHRQQPRLSRRVSKRSEELESISMIDMRSEEEGAGLLQPLGQSRYEGMQEQYTNHQEEEEEWQEDLARWKSRRRSASQDLIRKEEERKRMERMMKEEEGGHTQKRKNIKTYREIVEDKERREAELCDAYRRAGSKEEAAMVLQRYALRFTISDATLDSLQLPRTTTIDQNPESRTTTTNQNPESRTITTDQNPESRTITTDQNHESRTITTDQNPKSRTITTDQNHESRTITTDQNPKSRTITTDQNPESRTTTIDHNPESRTITIDQNPESRTTTTNQNPESRTITTDQNPESRTITTDQNHESRTITTDQNPESRTTTIDQNPESRTITTDQNPESRTTTTDQNPEPRTISTDQNPEPRTITTNQNPESRTTTTNQNPESRTTTTDQNPESRTTTTDHTPESSTITNQNPDPRTITTQNPDPRTITTDQNPERAGNGLEARQADTKQEPRAPKQPQTTVTHTKHTHTKHTHTKHTHTEHTHTKHTQLQTQNPQHTHTQNHSTQCQHTLHPPISPPSRPLPLLTAEPYCQPSHQQPGLKPDKVDGPSPLHSPPPTEHPGANQKTDASAISALIGGRNCVVTTTIVTELTQTHLQPRPSDMPSNTQVNSSLASSRRSGEEAGSDSSLLSNQHTYSSSVTEGLEGSSVTIESPMLNLAKRVDHWVWNPEEERRRQERWQLEQERFLQEQYLREQEKLKVVWERAQREVDEEERRHNEEEKRILEETATALSHFPPIELPVQTEVIVPAQQICKTEAIAHQNGQDQHAVSQLQFIQDASWDCESSRGQETSLDRNQPSVVKRSGSYDGPHPPSSSPSSPQPPSPSRCVSGKRQCSGCNQALGKGTAMNIDKLGLYFHLTCFKCGVCKGQLGDTSSGTDIRIGNGLLSCHDCYVTSHAAGQPTTL